MCSLLINNKYNLIKINESILLQFPWAHVPKLTYWGDVYKQIFPLRIRQVSHNEKDHSGDCCVVLKCPPLQVYSDLNMVLILTLADHKVDKEFLWAIAVLGDVHPLAEDLHYSNKRFSQTTHIFYKQLS